MSLRDQLSGIYQRHGILTPDIVVNEARPADSPLHNRFEWDDSIAAEAHRRAQAQELIRSVKVVYRPADEKESSKKIREWQAVRTERGSEYKPVEEVAMDPMLRKIVLADMEREWKALHRRYSQFSEFIAMVTADMNSNAA
jgi:hypothetical protein